MRYALVPGMMTLLTKALVTSYLAYAATHSGTTFQTYRAASLAADVYSCDIELTPKGNGLYGAPYTLIDCSK